MIGSGMLIGERGIWVMARPKRRKQVSEKSLELNVCAELLQLIRGWKDCQGALWLGLTQMQERQYGIDELIANTGPGLALMLQFKSPWATTRGNDLYKFTINEQQHAALEKIASKYPKAVQYVFPMYNRWAKAKKHAPDLCQDTWVVAVSSISLGQCASIEPKPVRHQVEMARNKKQMHCTVHSPEVVGTAENARDFFADPSMSESFLSADVGVPSDMLRAWLSELEPRNDGDVADWPGFRGLSALYVPVSQG